jgi:hypothetical protein
MNVNVRVVNIQNGEYISLCNESAELSKFFCVHAHVCSAQFMPP